MEKLVKLNKYAALAHAVSFVGVLCLYLLYTNSHPFATAVVYRNALAKQSELETTCNTTGNIVTGGGAGQCITDPIQGVPIKTKISFNIIYGCLFFFALTAYAHIFYATDGFGRGSYSKVVAEGWNPYRWAEYGISASVMSVLIGYALGVTDLAQLANFAGLAIGSAGLASVVFNAINPIFTFLLAALFLKRKISKKESLALFLGVLGVALIFNIWNIHFLLVNVCFNA
jgi:hypothetical protein